MTFRSQHISVAIDRAPDQVYAFAANPRNLPMWAAGLSGSIEQVDGEWISESPMGRVAVRLTPPNPYGVLDHEVVLPSGASVLNPMRVVPNADGSEVIFTVYQRPDMSDEMFAEDAKAVTRDLQRLKSLLEEGAAG